MKLSSSICAAALVICFAAGTAMSSGAKSFTIDDRQLALMQEINKGQKAKELTVKEAQKLRKALAKLANKKTKMKAKNKTLTSENQTELEADLNSISVDVQKLKLEKRTQVQGK